MARLMAYDADPDMDKDAPPNIHIRVRIPPEKIETMGNV